jgi:hypothetical protein
MNNVRSVTSFNPCKILWCEAKILKFYTPGAKIFTSVFTARFRDLQNTFFLLNVPLLHTNKKFIVAEILAVISQSPGRIYLTYTQLNTNRTEKSFT